MTEHAKSLNEMNSEELKKETEKMGKCISILGSTGSIGTQSLEVAKAHDMQVHALAANRNITKRHG